MNTENKPQLHWSETKGNPFGVLPTLEMWLLNEHKISRKTYQKNEPNGTPKEWLDVLYDRDYVIKFLARALRPLKPIGRKGMSRLFKVLMEELGLNENGQKTDSSEQSNLPGFKDESGVHK